jgi:hypothetical protein
MTAARPLAFAAVLLSIAAAVHAQTATPPEHAWSRGTTLNAFTGGISTGSQTGPVGGVAAGWERGPWFTLEGTGAWLRPDAGSSAFTASLGAHVNLVRPRAAVPFLKGGVGLYRASFDAGYANLPEFYARRAGTSRTFTDPAFVGGGGVTVFVTDRWAIRPQAEALIVRRDARHHTVGLMTVHLSYHFERHSPRGHLRSK